MLLKIAICDDDVKICSEIEKSTKYYTRSIQQKTDIKIFFSGEALLKGLHQGEYFDIIFLDIKLISTDGFKVAQKIRQDYNNNLMHIYYISSFLPEVKNLLQARPIDFLLKPFTAEDIWRGCKFFCVYKRRILLI